MADWKDCKDSGPWAFTEQPDTFGYLNNLRWSSQQDAIDFCEAKGLPLDLTDRHHPCSHWHKEKVSETPFPSGRWVAAMQQPGTPYIYVYDIVQKAVIRIDTSEIPVFVSSRLELNSTYDLDYTMGANVDSQHGGYCMNKDGTRIWYLFTEADGNRSDAELIEVDISKFNMLKIKSTIFSNLVPSESSPSSNNERIKDGCSDDVHTYWCTNLLAGRIIKIRNSDHSIIDSHIFNYAIECGSSGTPANKPIATIDVHKNTGKLYWIYTRDHSCSAPPYSVCKYFIRADLDLVADVEQVVCASGIMTAPGYQNMIKIYSDRVLLHQSYHPCTGPLTKWELNLSEENIVEGTNSKQYICKKDHTADTSLNKPVTGANWVDYWVEWNHRPDGNAWQDGKSYHCFYIQQELLNNILGVKNGKLFTLMYVCSGYSESLLYCIDFSDMAQFSWVDVSYYTGHVIFAPDPVQWSWTGVSALNQQTGVIVIFRYHLYEKRNYAGCFEANSDLELLCDVPLYSVKHDSGRIISDEPMIWSMPG